MRHTFRIILTLLVTGLSVLPARAGDWPMWRYDAARSGASPDALPADLHLQWSLQLPKPRPAWRGDQDKLQFDRSYEPIVVGSLLIVPSMSRDSVSAYDTRTAALKWRFYADGPVRFAPAGHHGDLFFTSDDGFLYCLRASDGDLKWKLRGGPSDLRILGNDRLISAWPARGGPVVKDGVVYFAASIWPFMGTFIHAVDCKTGHVIWTNSGSGSNYIIQQHGSPAFAGVAPQGYLAAGGDTLLVAGGRTVPAAYALKDGEFRYFIPGTRTVGKDLGGYAVSISGDWFFNRDALYEMNKGNYAGKYRADVILPPGIGETGPRMVTLNRDQLAVRPLPPEVVKGDAIDLKALWSKTPTLKFPGQITSTLPENLGRAFIAAGSRLYCDGEDGLIAAVDAPATESATIAWRGHIRGNVFSMIAGDNRLFVVTREGWVFCFGGGKPAVAAALPNAKAVGNDDADGLLLLVKRGAEWKYLANGTTPAEGWQALAFDDAAWEDDRVELDEDEEAPASKPLIPAAVPGGPDIIKDPSKVPEKPKPVTYYYRHVFSVRDCRALDDVKVLVMTDDGALVFLNGKPLAKLEAKDGTGDPKPPRDPKRNKRASHELSIDPSLLVEGKNVLAMMLPNQRVAPPPEDMFNFEIIAERAPGTADESRPEPKWVTKAGAILKLAGGDADEGIAAVYGAGDGDLIDELARHTSLQLIGIEPDAMKVLRLRERFDKADLLGERIALHAGKAGEFTMPPYLLSLAICPDMAAAGCSDKAAAVARIYSALRPYGGVAIFGIDDSMRTLFEQAVKEAKLFGAEISFSPGYAALRRTGGPQGAGNWTAQNGDVGNTLVSSEKAVKLPLGVLWFGGPSNAKILPRHGHGPVPQVLDGRLFIEGPDLIRAMDIYTGRLLWDRKLKGLGLYYNNTAHHPGAGAVGGNYVSMADGVYVAYGRKLLRLDPTSGKTVSEFSLPADGAEKLRINGPVKVQVEATGDPARDALATGTPPIPFVPDDSSTTTDSGLSSTDAAGTSPFIGFIGVHENLLLAGSTPLPPLAVSRNKIDNTTLEPRFGEGSRRIVAMDRKTGDVLWKRDALFEFRHNTIVAGSAAGKSRVFCIDFMTNQRLSVLKKRGVVIEGAPHLYALDAKTGDVLWRTNDRLFGTWLGYSEKHDVLLQAGSKARDRGGDEPGRGMVAYRGATGEVIWENDVPYVGPCMLHDRTIITQGEAYDLLTGNKLLRNHPITGVPLPWDWQRNYGCNTAIGCENLLTFRSAAAGFFDLAGDGGTGNLGGFRSSCTNNLVPAGGILSAPDYTRTCTCSYQNQTSLALIHMPSVEVWTFNPIKWDGKPVRQLGINFGAPGDHRPAGPDSDDSIGGGNETLWLDYPSTGGKSPDVPLRIATVQGKPAVTYFRQHASTVDDKLGFVAASGLRGECEIEITLADASVKGTRDYTVRLVFCEMENVKPGQRVFDVGIGKLSTLPAFDIAKEAGPRRAVVKEIKGVKVGEKLTITLKAAGGSSPPVLSGVEIVQE
jgi:outer membrane protein assembly factor BamB